MARFYRSPRWKHLLTTRDSLVVTDLSRLASNRSGRFELGGPSFIQGYVPSHDFRVYFPSDDEFPVAPFDPFWQDDIGFKNYPRLAEGVRLMYSFRRDNAAGSPWTVRHAGPVLELEDDADPDRRLSRFVAFDPWAYLFQRPVRLADPDPFTPDLTINPMPKEPGAVFPAGTTGDAIACELLRRSIEEDGITYIDAGTAFGGTSDYAGTIETTADFVDPMVFSREMSLGEAWTQLVDTGTMDIVLTPIFDPLNRPGYCAELNIFSTAGGDPRLEVFAGFPMFHWDRVGRSLVRINRLTEGRERANRIRAYAGGTAAASAPWTGSIGDTSGAPDTEASWSDAMSSARYGESWHSETFVRQARGEFVGRQARSELIRRREGQRTWRLSPTPEFSPRPFQDYMPGTWVGFSHSERLREDVWWLPHQFNDQESFPRIFGFDITLSDDSLETVSALDITLDIHPASLV